MTDLAIADHRATFAAHPLEGSSRFILLGLLAELKGLVKRNKQHDDRDMANAMFGERVVNAMFGDGPVRVTVSNGSESAASTKHVSPETKVQDA